MTEREAVAHLRDALERHDSAAEALGEPPGTWHVPVQRDALATVTRQHQDTDVPNWYDGPIVMFAVVDRHGTAFVFDTERKAVETMERWEGTLKQFAPYKLITLVEQREE